MDPRAIVGAAVDTIAGGIPDEIRADYLDCYDGDRFAESMRYVRTYPEELPQLAELLPQITTPVTLINGSHDRVVPLANAEFLDERLPTAASWSSTPGTSSGRRSRRRTRRPSSTRWLGAADPFGRRGRHPPRTHPGGARRLPPALRGRIAVLRLDAATRRATCAAPSRTGQQVRREPPAGRGGRRAADARPLRGDA